MPCSTCFVTLSDSPLEIFLASHLTPFPPRSDGAGTLQHFGMLYLHCSKGGIRRGAKGYSSPGRSMLVPRRKGKSYSPFDPISLRLNWASTLQYYGKLYLHCFMGGVRRELGAVVPLTFTVPYLPYSSHLVKRVSPPWGNF